MTDPDLVAKKLAFIETRLRELSTLARLDRIREDLKEERFVEHTLQLAIQAALDVASHIVSDERLGEPATNRELFDRLVVGGWISHDLAAKLGDMAGFIDRERLLDEVPGEELEAPLRAEPMVHEEVEGQGRADETTLQARAPGRASVIRRIRSPRRVSMRAMRDARPRVGRALPCRWKDGYREQTSASSAVALNVRRARARSARRLARVARSGA